MSKQSTIEDCGVGPKPRGSQRNRTTTTNVLAADAANKIAEAQQADLAAVLSELQALRTTVSSINTKISAVDDFGNKLDNVEKRITEMNGSVAAVQRSFADLKADIIANDKRLTEAEDRIGTAEEDIERVKLQLTDAVKRIAYLESKTEDLENRGRRKNLRLVGLPESAEKTRPMVEFIQHMLPIWLGLDTSRTFVLERAHRTLAKPRPERERNANFESSQSVIEKNRETIWQLKHANENMRKKLAEGEEQVTKDVFQDRGMENESFRNMPVKSALTVLEKEVCDKAKKLNALKQTTDTQRQRLEELKRQYESMKPLPDNQELDEEKKLRILENRLEEAQLKRHEAKNVMRGYLKEKDKLQGDSFTFQPRLDRMEAEIHRQTQVLKELQVTNGDAHFSKDAAMAELQLQDEKVCRERRRREKILSLYKKQQEERIAQAKERKRRASIIHHTSDNNLPDELSSEANAVEEVEAISPFEEAFQQIREATGVTDPRELVGLFISRRKTQERLLKMKAENERLLLPLKEERNMLQTQLQDMEYSVETELSSSLQVCELQQQLEQTQQRRDAAKDRLYGLKHALNAAKAGVKHLSDKLQHIPLMKGPTPQLPPDSEEQTLQLMSEAEQKLMLLKEELQGKDLATILKEIEEEEFLAKLAEDQPQYNRRILFREDQKQDSFDDEDNRSNDEDVITSVMLKQQPQAFQGCLA
ncbi:unnamed protein product [Leuciscus chuanchicus]